MQKIRLLNTTLKTLQKRTITLTVSLEAFSWRNLLRNTKETQGLTNLSNRGLISKDHGTKATLFFTIPRSKLKSPT